MRDIEQKIREVGATMAMEGMPLTNEDESRLRKIFSGEATVEDIIKNLVNKFTQKRGVST